MRTVEFRADDPILISIKREADLLRRGAPMGRAPNASPKLKRLVREAVSRGTPVMNLAELTGFSPHTIHAWRYRDADAPLVQELTLVGEPPRASVSHVATVTIGALRIELPVEALTRGLLAELAAVRGVSC